MAGWGQFHYERGWETMGDVVTRLAEVKGGAVLSKLKMPFAEAKTCTDYASGCSFCPCGAMRLTLRGATLEVNEQEVMLLHLAQSKFAWAHAPAARAADPGRKTANLGPSAARPAPRVGGCPL